MGRSRKQQGFTIIELLAVICIIALLTAIVVPTGIHMIRASQETKNANIARSVFVSMQNVLTDMKTSGRLNELARFEDGRAGALTGGFLFEKHDTRGILTTSIDGVVDEDGDSLYYLMLRQNGADDEALLRMLEPNISDPSILSASISVELNARTGMVSAVFFSDEFDSFVYDNSEEPYNSALAANRNNSYQRGFYGVATTGSISEGAASLEVQLIDGPHWLTAEAGEPSDMIPDTLYAAVTLPEENSQGTYTLSLTDRYGAPILSGSKPVAVTFRIDAIGSDHLTVYSLEGALNGTPYKDLEGDAHARNDAILYLKNNTVYWIIDYVDPGSEASPDLSHSIVSLYPDFTPGDIRAKVQKLDGLTRLNTSNTEHSHYDSALSEDTYAVTNLRHLSNVRYRYPADAQKETTFRQLCDLDLSKIENFAPLNWVASGSGFDKDFAFTGSYIGSYVVANLTDEPEPLSFFISHLTIGSEENGGADLGLFGALKDAKIQGLSLFESSISSASGGNVGAFAGSAEASELIQCMAYGDVKVSNTSGTHPASAGGLVGLLENSSLKLSYNGGYYDAGGTTDSDIGSVAVTGYQGVANATVSVGGLCGTLTGAEAEISNCYNNARVNIASASYHAAGEGDPAFVSFDPVYETFQHGNLTNTYFGGIAGRNLNGKLNNVYNTNFVASYTVDAVFSNSGSVVGMSERGSAGNSYAIDGILAKTDSSEASQGGALSKDALSVYIFNKSLWAPNDKSYTEQGLPSASSALAENYPYPVLQSNPHRTPWEDIEGSLAPPDVLQYVDYKDDVNLFGENYRLFTIETKHSFGAYQATDMKATLTWNPDVLTLDNTRAPVLGAPVTPVENGGASVTVDLKNNGIYYIRFFANPRADEPAQPDAGSVTFLFEVEAPSGASLPRYQYQDSSPQKETP